MLLQIINQIADESSSKRKKMLLEQQSGNETLKKILKMTYDTVGYTYGIGKLSLSKMTYTPNSSKPIEYALNILETDIASRKVTGMAAIELVESLLGELSTDDAVILRRVIERDLRMNIGATTINAIWSGLIAKPAYMRCAVFSKKTAEKIKYPAYCQLKSNGEYIEITKNGSVVTARTRAGEPAEYPIIFNEMANYADGVYTGELTVKGVPDRSMANGLLNSKNPPHSDIMLELWDYITLKEYNIALAKNRKNKCTIPYEERFTSLVNTVSLNNSSHVSVIETHMVSDYNEVISHTKKWIKLGLEGSVLKDKSGIFEYTTSKHQLKLKLKVEVDMRCVGFEPGTMGTAREGKVGSIIFENDERTIIGSCSGFTEEMLDDMTYNGEKYIGKILEVAFNDLVKTDKNDFYTFSHPRFNGWRFDKTEPDTLQRVIELRDAATNLE